ncbi:TetR/AcrR family transcriptional regulator [Streptomyces sp. CMB-StM0423]|uniref:TetR/AcrR family transcriptional regulator n=1 Tax=Streptomyces sp. CMB-StM0423 TaxID=2059884 RepID=UPI0018FF0EDE|nr:TetR family transcriptional regulator [Streptomyces sp. CMB-StM0423]
MASSRTSAAPPVAASQAASVAEAGLGLRERKKLRTRQAIRQAAYRLIGKQGYEQTTVEQIAEAAEVSPSTVFRYFATKEDIILTDEYDPVLEQAILDRPADEPPLVALREAVVASLRLLYDEFRPEFVLRMQLVREVPALRAQMHQGMDQNVELLCRVLSERTGRPRDDFELRVVVGAIFGALTQVLFEWVDRGPDCDLVETVDRALAVLERGLTL